MFEWLWPVLAWGEVVLLLGYAGLFLARKDVRIRYVTVGVIQIVGIAGQLGFLIANWADHTSTSIVALLAQVTVMTAFFSIRGAYLIRTRQDDVQAEIEEACRRLFIDQQEPQPGVLLLGAKGVMISLRQIKMGPLTLVLFPRPPLPGKLTLFFDWLAKRYPGPIPRIRVSLNRR